MKRISARACLFASLVTASALAHAMPLPQQRLAPGGVARIALGTSTEAPKASFNGVPAMVVRDGAQWVAVSASRSRPRRGRPA